MPAGPKNQLITLQMKNGVTRDSYGAEVPIWVDHVEVWAEVIQPTAREIISLRAQQADITTQFVINYVPEVNAGMQLIWNGQVYRIIEAAPPPRAMADLVITGIAEAYDA